MAQDLILECKDCGVYFLFPTSEQDFFARQGFTHQPERCHACRAAKRREMAALRKRAEGPTAIVCDGCGREAEVPFVPYKGQPVFCRRCFAQRVRPDRWAKRTSLPCEEKGSGGSKAKPFLG